MSENSAGLQERRKKLRSNVQHMRRRVHRLRALLRALLSKPRKVDRPLEKNLRLLRRCALTLMPASLASSTRMAYLRCYWYRKRMRLLDPAATANGQPITMRSWRYNRASLQFGFATEMLDWLNTPEDVQAECHGLTYDVFAECNAWMRRLEVILHWAPPGVRIGNQTASSSQINPATNPVSPVSVKRPVQFKPGKSKRVGLSSLGKEWRQTYWKHVSAKARYRHHIAALLLTGARPCEFESGIRVRLVSAVSGDRTKIG